MPGSTSWVSGAEPSEAILRTAALASALLWLDVQSSFGSGSDLCQVSPLFLSMCVVFQS